MEGQKGVWSLKRRIWSRLSLILKSAKACFLSPLRPAALAVGLACLLPLGHEIRRLWMGDIFPPKPQAQAGTLLSKNPGQEAFCSPGPLTPHPHQIRIMILFVPLGSGCSAVQGDFPEGRMKQWTFQKTLHDLVR